MEEEAAAPGCLYVCGTPIGNLDDVTPRLRATLAAVGAIACEDTRRTRQLLSALDLRTPRLISYREDNERAAADEVLGVLEHGRDVALVTDAGMPAVSDPGVPLARRAHERGIAVRVVPGPSAETAALAVAGCGGSGHRFVGFLPRSSDALRRLLLETAFEVVVAFESPRRVAATLRAIAEVQPERMVATCRELTKRHEHTRLARADVLAADPGEERGEFVLVLDALAQVDPAGVDDRAVSLVLELVDEGVRMKAACRHVAAYADVSSRQLYQAALQRRSSMEAGGDDAPA